MHYNNCCQQVGYCPHCWHRMNPSYIQNYPYMTPYLTLALSKPNDENLNPRFYQSFATFNQNIKPRESIKFEGVVESHGNWIKHDRGSTAFILSPAKPFSPTREQQNLYYSVFFSVNGTNITNKQGMIFAIKVDGRMTDSRINAQDSSRTTKFFSGSCTGVVKVGKKPVTIEIVNIGIDDFESVNANILIYQLAI